MPRETDELIEIFLKIIQKSIKNKNSQKFKIFILKQAARSCHKDTSPKSSITNEINNMNISGEQ